MVRILKIYSLCNFQVYTIALLIVTIMLYIKSSELIQLITESFFILTNISWFPLLPSHWQPPCFCLHEFDYSNYFKLAESYSLCLWLPYFTEHSVLKFHPCGYILQNSLIFKGWIIFHVSIYHIFFIYPSADGHLGCFHTVAVVNSAAVNKVCRNLNILWRGTSLVAQGLRVYLVMQGTQVWFLVGERRSHMLMIN